MSKKKNKKKKKAFTLVELLAVIVILAVILIIAIPQIMNTVRETKLKTIEGSARLIATNAEKDYLAQQVLNTSYNAANIPCSDVAKLSDDYADCTISYDSNGVATVTLEGTNKFEGITCSGTKDNMSCGFVSPYLYSAMTPHYQYTVTDFDACKPVVKQILIDRYYKSSSAAETLATSICNNSDNIDGYGRYDSTASYWFNKSYNYGYTYTVTNTSDCSDWVSSNFGYNASMTAEKCGNTSQTSKFFDGMVKDMYPLSFLSRSTPNIFASFLTRSNKPTNFYEDYEDVKAYDVNTLNTLYETNIFLRWNRNVDFDKYRSLDANVCVTYEENNETKLNCFTSNNYSLLADQLQTAFGTGNCTSSDSSISCSKTYGNISFECGADSWGISCSRALVSDHFISCSKSFDGKYLASCYCGAGD